MHQDFYRTEVVDALSETRSRQRVTGAM